MTIRDLSIRHLVFTGTGLNPAELEFCDGSNLIWGASNTGKSFTLKALDFMLGGSTALPDIGERQGYETVCLGISIGGVGDFTLSRAAAGGNFMLYDGLVKAPPQDKRGRPLGAKHDSKKDGNLSKFLLDQLGFAGRFVAKDAHGEKNSLSFRNLANVLLVDETSIQAERSPIEGGDRGDISSERSVFRLLLTGTDDSAIVPVSKPKDLKAAKAVRLELLDEIIADIETRLVTEHPNIDGYADQNDRLTETLEQVQAQFDAAEGSIRGLLDEKQKLAAEIPRVGGRLDDIAVHLDRFAKLDRAYESDIQRLEAIEEAGFLVSLGGDRDCPLCGAGPDAQAHTDGMVRVEQVRAAALAETTKINRLRTDLEQTTADLHAEQGRLKEELPRLLARLEVTEADITELLPQVSETRRMLKEVLAARDRVQQGLVLREQRQGLLDRRKDAESVKAVSKENRPKLELSGTVAHDFCKVVGRVLTEWQFPGERQISFDEKTYDIRIDGKLRSNNGKGVRAVTHAAFKVALLIFCRERDLPHPGLVVLDTPLLTYRDPIRNPKFGDLSTDEKALAQTALKQRFFEHLHSIRDLGQFIVFENVDLPEKIEAFTKIEVFLGHEGGRNGFFPIRG